MARELSQHSSNSAAITKLSADRPSEWVLATFKHHFALIAEGYDGTAREEDLLPLDLVKPLADLKMPDTRNAARVAQIKLNGGLGTSMGTRGAKSSMLAKDGLTFLDIIAKQTMSLAEDAGPLVFLNSYNTDAQTRSSLGRYDELDLRHVEQGRVPRLLAGTLEPISVPGDRSAEWAPPGHGELLSILADGLAEDLLANGNELAIISNADNLGATVDPRIAEYMRANNLPMVNEVCRRTAEDVKGGHVARRRTDRRLLVRDSNMVHPRDQRAYMDISKHKFFNTNNLWIDLRALLEMNIGAASPLPLIVNPKDIDTGSSTVNVLQLETGMGTAVGLFDRCTPIEVPRSRFIPVKDTAQLLILRSDFYSLNESNYSLAPAREERPRVTLDAEYFRKILDFEKRFPDGAPSLRQCTSLTVGGDFTLHSDLALEGDVELP